MTFLRRGETLSFTKSTKTATITQNAGTALFFFDRPNVILSNDPDHAGAQIACVSKETNTYWSDK